MKTVTSGERFAPDYDDLQRIVAEHLPGVTYVCENDERFRMRYLSENVLELTGIPAGEFLADRASFVDLFHPEDAAEVFAGVETAIRKQEPFQLRYRIQRANGQYVWAEERGRGIYDSDGELLYLTGVIFNIQDQRQYETAVRRMREEAEAHAQRRAELIEEARQVVAREAAQIARNEQFSQDQEFTRHVVDNAPTLICAVAPDGATRYVNAAVRDITGYEPEEVLGKCWWDLLYPGEARREVDRLMADFSRSPSVINYDMQLVAKDGTPRIVSWNSVNRLDSAGRIVEIVGLGMDITARRQAEEKLAEEEQLLRQLYDVQERERKLLAYEIHDGFVQDVVGAKLILEAVENKISSSETANEADLTKIKDLLVKAIDEGRRLCGDLRPLVIDEEGLVEGLRFLAETHAQRGSLDVEFTHDIQSDPLPPLIEGTLFRVAQEALTNVQRHSGAHAAELRLIERGAFLTLEVVDHGRGFDAAKVRTDRLGLEGIRRRAAIFGGTASITSQPGKGTTVRVTLPMEPSGGSAPS